MAFLLFMLVSCQSPSTREESKKDIATQNFYTACREYERAMRSVLPKKEIDAARSRLHDAVFLLREVDSTRFPKETALQFAERECVPGHEWETMF